MQPDPAALQDFATRYAAAWSSQNPSSVASFFAPEGSLTVNGGPPAVGRAAISQVAHSFMAAFPDLQVHLDNLKILADHAEFHWTLIGANTGPGGKGNHVRISGYESWQLSPDGLIAVSDGHFDVSEYQRQLEGNA